MNFRESVVYRVLSGIAIKIYAATGFSLLSCFIIYYFYSGLVAFLLLLFFVLGILFQAQDNLLYHPENPLHSRVYIPVPSIFNLPYETLNLRTRDKDPVTLHGFFIRHPGEKGNFCPTMIFLHGNAGNLGHRLQNANGFYHSLACNVLLIEYRGYGLSTGAPSEKGLYTDVRVAIDYLFTRHDIDHNQIIIFGRSLGGAVAIDAAADAVYGSKVMCVLVENTFTSIPEMAVKLIHPYIGYVPLCFYKNKYLSINKINHLSAPILFISGLNDSLVSPKMMTKLYTRCGSRKQLLQIAGGSHNDTWTFSGYYQGINAFVNECKELKGAVPIVAPVRQNLSLQIEEV